MQSKCANIAEYLESLPPDRRAPIEAVRDVILANLDSGYEEGMQYGMIGYYIPHSVFPAGYHCDPRQPLPFAGIASQKQYISLYLAGVYCGCGEHSSEETPDARWLRAQWAATGKKLDMGKACIRFKKLEDVALGVLGEAIRRIPAKLYIERYCEVLAEGEKHKADAKARKNVAAQALTGGRGKTAGSAKASA